MDELAGRIPNDRAAVFRTAGADCGLPPLYVEKDFWVCWLLHRIFDAPLVEGMVFKGGTSLNKVWNAIQRFSEDIDLTLPQASLHAARDIVIEDSQSATQRKALKTQVDAALQEWCRGEGRDAIAERIEEALGDTVGWQLTADGESLDFEYPASLPADREVTDYVLPRVRLEFGAVMPVAPAEDASLRPYCARAGRYVMANPDVSVRVLAAERTFWEKATLVHAENHRPEPKPVGSRLSRHYADLAALARGEIGGRALQRMDILRAVVREKRRYFHAGWARYEDAAEGRLQLLPPAGHEKVLRRDYGGMREMYFAEPLDFNDVLECLGDLEKNVNNRS